MEEVRKVKQLQSQLNVLSGDAEALKMEIANKQRDYSLKLQSITRLKEEIAKIKDTKVPTVSEHAILRYLERVKGLNIPEIEKEILSDEVLKLVDYLGGSGTYPNGLFSVVMKNYCVTTVV